MKDTLYLIGPNSGGPIKVGYSSDCEKRLLQIRTNCHLPLKILHTIQLSSANAIKLEAVLHNKLSPYRLEGEWFMCSRSVIMRLIDQIQGETNGYRDWKTIPEKLKSPPWMNVWQKAGAKASASRKKAETAKLAKVITKEMYENPAYTNDALEEISGLSINTIKDFYRDKWGTRRAAIKRWKRDQRKRMAA